VQRVSGVLEIEGNPDGTVYFDQGEITFAQASWIPDLGTRLRGALPLTTALQDALSQDALSQDGTGSGAAGGGDLGAVLVERNLIGRDGLAELLRSVIVDAVLALTLPLADGSAVSDIRFEAPGTHWAAGFGRLSVASVRAEAAALGGELARYGLAYTTPVRLCDLDGGSATLTREQWASACRISDTASPLDLAWRHGMALYEAMGCVGELVRAGLCAPCPPDAGSPAPGGVLAGGARVGGTGAGTAGAGAREAGGGEASTAEASTAEAGGSEPGAAGASSLSAHGATTGGLEAGAAGASGLRARGAGAGGAGAGPGGAAAGARTAGDGAEPARPGWEFWSTADEPVSGAVGPPAPRWPVPVLPSGLPQRRPYAWSELTALGGAGRPDGDRAADALLTPPDLLRRVLEGLRNL
jgi:hypothetical protein